MTTNDHPLGDIEGTGPKANPDIGDDASIVDSILDLSSFLSAEVRLAERSFRLFTRPDLEARIDDLNAELDSLLDAHGRPLTGRPSQAEAKDRAVGDGGAEESSEAARTAGVVATELGEVQALYFRESSRIVVRAMDDESWATFDAKYGEAIRKGSPYPPDAIRALVSKTAVHPTFTPDQVTEFRKRVGSPVMLELARTAWGVNTESGVNIPKSLISSVATGRGPLG